MSLILILPVLVTGLAYWSVFSVRMASAEVVSPPFGGALIASMIGAIIFLGAALLGGGVIGGVQSLTLGLFGAILAVCAWTDHQTSYAPDGLVLPLLLGGAYLPIPMDADLNLEVWPALGAICLFIFSQGAWRLQVRSGMPLLTPPDLLVLLLPVLVFGLNTSSWVTYLLMCAPLAFLINAPDAVYRMIRGPAAQVAAREIGFRDDVRSAPLLPISLGALGVVSTYLLVKGG